MKSGVRIAVFVINILYPFAILAGLLYLEAPLRVFPIALGSILLINLVADFPEMLKGNRAALLKVGGMVLAVGGVVLLMTLSENAGYAKLYPVFINLSLLVTFGLSLLRPPTIIWRFATMQNRSLNDHPDRDRAIAYCRKVTWIWSAFFVLNALAALITALWASDTFWSIYNGMVSYILIGLLFLGELIVRKRLGIGS